VDKLKKNTSYVYLAPKNIDSILEKEKIDKKDYQDTSYAGHVGRALEVDTLIYGTVLAYNSRDEVKHIKGERDPSTGERLFQDRIKFIRAVDVAIKFEIVPVDGGKPVNKTLSAETRSDEEGQRDGFAQAALEPEEDLLKRALDEVTESLTRLIAPYYVEEEWPLKEGEHPELKKGIEHAKKGEWDQARSSWKMLVSDEDSSPADKDAAMFNLGLLAESEGKLEEATKIFQELYDKDNDSETLKILKRIKKKKL
jgi:tetratricopeptide (TPR) repeat protein